MSRRLHVPGQLVFWQAAGDQNPHRIAPAPRLERIEDAAPSEEEDDLTPGANGAAPMHGDRPNIGRTRQRQPTTQPEVMAPGCCLIS
jgi:hypothetical protein